MCMSYRTENKMSVNFTVRPPSYHGHMALNNSQPLFHAIRAAWKLPVLNRHLVVQPGPLRL